MSVLLLRIPMIPVSDSGVFQAPRAAIAVKWKIRQWRQRYARPLLEALWSWLEEQEQRCPPGGALHRDTAPQGLRRRKKTPQNAFLIPSPLVSTSTPVANIRVSTSRPDANIRVSTSRPDAFTRLSTCLALATAQLKSTASMVKL
ncbi:ISSfl3 OrfC [Escherichia coli]|nr:ISSfl3 OrfC [Escherichia coli]SQY98242.1 ISSfl3 OrfC [Escherichia coli]